MNGPHTPHRTKNVLAHRNFMKLFTHLLPAALLTLILSACDQSSHRGNGETFETADMDVFSLSIGDCFNDAPVSQLPITPCSSPHDNEVYAVFNTSLDTFPGADEMYDAAFEDCRNRFEAFVGLPYDNSILNIYTIHPTQLSWTNLNDREIICALYSRLSGAQLTGSMAMRGI